MIELGLLWEPEGHVCAGSKGRAMWCGGQLPVTRKGITKMKVQSLVLPPQHL